MTHPQNLSDRRHRHPAAVGGPDLPVAILAQILGEAVELRLAGGVLLGEGCKALVGLGCFATRPCDRGIVRRIPASQLA
jgi:hypothetical protein